MTRPASLASLLMEAIRARVDSTSALQPVDGQLLRGLEASPYLTYTWVRRCRRGVLPHRVFVIGSVSSSRWPRSQRPGQATAWCSVACKSSRRELGR